MTAPAKALAIIGTLCIAVTVLVYLLLIPAGMGFFALSLVALLLSELMLVAGLAIAAFLRRKSDSVLTVAGSVSLTCVCSVVLFVTGLVFIPAPLAMVGVFLSICLLTVLAYGVGLAILLLAGKRLLQREDAEMQLNQANLARANKLKDAASLCSNQALKVRISKLADDVRYDDGSVCVAEAAAMDEDIDALCNALKISDEAAAEKLTDELFWLERNRREKTALIRRGGM